ncbi:MAG: hypothetical protein HC923_11500 [Myxococcales bacterium]|nr:hypothetical protein [Myxococcales bacterium]
MLEQLFTESHDVAFPFSIAIEVAEQRDADDESIARLLARGRFLDPLAEREGRDAPSVDVARRWAEARFGRFHEVVTQ